MSKKHLQQTGLGCSNNGPLSCSAGSSEVLRSLTSPCKIWNAQDVFDKSPSHYHETLYYKVIISTKKCANGANFERRTLHYGEPQHITLKPHALLARAASLTPSRPLVGHKSDVSSKTFPNHFQQEPPPPAVSAADWFGA